MIRTCLVALLCLLAATVEAAEERQRMSATDAVTVQAVGRLNIAGNSFCTATLISDRLVLTAAHCLFHPVNKQEMPAKSFRFVAGQRRDSEAAVRDVRYVARLPEFKFDAPASLSHVGDDLAILELAEPVSAATVAPFPVTDANRDAPLSIVSYARDRPYVPSIQGPCPVVTFAGRVGILACAINFGASGAPVLTGMGRDRRIVAVVSAMGEDQNGGSIALVVPVASRMTALLAALERAKVSTP